MREGFLQIKINSRYFNLNLCSVHENTAKELELVFKDKDCDLERLLYMYIEKVQEYNLLINDIERLELAMSQINTKR